MFTKAVVLGVGLSGAMLGEYSAFKVNISDIIFLYSSGNMPNKLRRVYGDEPNGC
jgi:hypothetical protein